MPALPFLNSMGLAPNLTDITTWPDGSVVHQGRTACCFVVACRWPSTLVQALGGPHVAGIGEKLLFFQLCNEVGPTHQDRVVAVLRQGSKRKGFEDWN